ncbi:MAG: Ig-like domain repeat protein, partial [Lachnospiraceae bacterium]|nr:Ig-like domain repeat protein [Lachnospiraceae bacterium]
FKNPTKAANDISNTYEQELLLKEGVGVGMVGSDLVLSNGGLGEFSGPHLITINTLSDSLTFNITVGGKFKDNGKEYYVESCNVVVVPSDDADPSYKMSVTDAGAYTNNTVSTANPYVHIYIQPTRCATSDGEEYPNSFPVYMKLATYTINKATVETVIDNSAMWVDGTGNYVTTEVNSASLSIATGVDYLESIKYVAKTSGTEAPTADEWANAAEAITVNVTGTYDGYVGVFTNNATYPAYIYKLANTVTVDADVPELVKCELIDENGNEVTGSQNNYYLANGVDYSVRIYLEESNPSENITITCRDNTDTAISPVDYEVSYDVVGEYYECDDFDVSFVLDHQYSLSAELVDKFNNGQGQGTELGTYTVVDKTFKHGTPVITPEGGESIGATFATGGDITISGTAHTITIPVSSGNELVSATVSYNDKSGNPTSVPVSLSDVDATNTIYSTDFEYTFNADGEYNDIQIVFADKEESLPAISLGNFALDTKVPNIVYGGLYKKNGENWDLVTNTLDTYTVNTTIADNYRFVFYAMDEATGITQAKYYTGAVIEESLMSNMTADSTVTVPSEYAGYTAYVIDFKTSDLTTAATVYTAQVKDKAGKINTRTATPVKASSDKIEMGTVTLKSDGKTVDITDDYTGSQISNKKYEVEVTAYSGYPITSITVKDDDGDATTIDFSVTEDVSADNEAIEGYRYKVTKKITIPGGTVDTNTLLKNAQVIVTDSAPIPSTVSRNLGELLYDSTKPVIINPENTTGIEETNENYGKFLTDDQWYNADDAKTISAIITPGPQAVESKLSEVSYTVSNSNGANGTTPVTVDDTNNTKVQLAGENSILVPESKTTNGTTITFNAKDQAGNTLDKNNSVTIKVDTSIPKVKSTKINGKNDNQLAGIGSHIWLEAELEDNLLLDKFTVNIIDSDGEIVATKDVSYTWDISKYTDTSLNFSNLDDGTYTVQFIVTDKAGNVSDPVEKEITVGSALTVNTNVSRIESEYYKPSIGATFGTADEPTISNKEHEVVVSIQSGYKPTKIDVYSGTSTTPIYSERLQVADKPQGQELYYVTRSIELPANGNDGIYSDLRVVVTDSKIKAGGVANTKEAKLGTFIYDTTKPEIEFKGLYKKNSDGTWTQITQSNLSSNGAYTVNATKDATYRYVYEVEELTSGFDEDSLKIQGGFNYNYTYIENMLLAVGEEKLLTDAEGYEYYAEFTTDELIGHINSYGGGSDNKLMMRAYGKDRAQNDADAERAGFYVQAQDTDLAVDAVLYKDYNSDTKEGTVISINGTDDTFTNKAYTLVVEASSPYCLTSYTLTYGYGTEAKPVTSVVITAEENAAGFDEHSQRYTVVKEITIPVAAIDGGVINNQVLENIILTVVDEGSENDYEETLGTLFYDATLPYLEATSYEDGLLIDDETWYQEFLLKGNIYPGKQATETDIVNTTLTAGGSVDGDGVINSDEQNGVYTKNADEETGLSYMSFAYFVAESKEVTGTTVAFEAYDRAGNYLPDNKTGVIRVDGTEPKVDFTINDLAQPEVPIIPNIELDIHATDNLTLSKITVDVKQLDGDKKVNDEFTYDSGKALKEIGAEELAIDETYSFELTDGLYEVTVVAYDKADNASESVVKTFEVDNTDPTNTVKIISGKTAGKQPSKNFDDTDRDYFYSGAVTLEFTYTEKNMKTVTITDGTNPVNVTFTQVGETDKYVGSYPISGSGKHEITILTEDLTGHKSKPMTISFVIDGDGPTVQSLINGGISYTESMGMLMLTSNTTVAYTVSDSNEDADDFNIQIIKKEPDVAAAVGEYLPTTNRSFSFADEAEYTVNAYAIDMAGNQSLTNTVNFRVDTAAPALTIGGIGDGGNSSTPVTVSFNMQEKFWQDATGTVEIYRKAADGFGESLMETIDYDPTSANSSVSRTLSD